MYGLFKNVIAGTFGSIQQTTVNNNDVQQMKAQALQEQEMQEQEMQEQMKKQIYDKQINEQKMIDEQIRQQQMKAQALQEQEMQEQMKKQIYDKQINEQKMIDEQIRQQQMKAQALQEQIRQQQIKEQELQEQIRQHQIKEQELQEQIRQQQIKEQEMQEQMKKQINEQKKIDEQIKQQQIKEQEMQEQMNQNKPENQNINVSKMRDNYILIFDGNQWQLKERDDILQQQIKEQEMQEQMKKQIYDKQINEQKMIDEQIKKMNQQTTEEQLKEYQVMQYQKRLNKQIILKQNVVCIYALLLEENKYYVGKSTNIIKRLEDHNNANAAAWTTKYPPIFLLEAIPDCSIEDEDKYTLKYMKEYGIENVRGGSFCQVNMSSETVNVINKMIKTTNDLCYNCGKSGHFIKECKEKVQIIEPNIAPITKRNTGALPKNNTKRSLPSQRYHQRNKYISDSDSDSDSVDNEVYCCNKCGKVFDTQKGASFHENFYCKTKVTKAVSKNANACYRCGREGHYVSDCYATTHVKGYLL